MSNNIELAQKFLPIVDEIYKINSITSRMDSENVNDIKFDGTNVVKIMKLTTVGLGNYSRSTGYPVGDVNLSFEPWTLTIDRGRELSVDRMDNEETLGTAFGKLASEFITTFVVPETDAYRFAKYASTPGIGEDTSAITAANVLEKIDEAKAALDDAGVPEEGRLLYLSYPVRRALEQSVNRSLSNEQRFDRRVRELDGVPIIGVPQSRFYTGITLDPGATSEAGGYAKATGASDINFMLIYPKAVVQANKFDNMKIFDPDSNQKKDAWLFQYRQYYDAFVYENKVSGIFVNKKA